MQTGSYYVFRSTIEKLPEHTAHIIESGDTIVTDPIFVGGRDWNILCRRGSCPTVTDGLVRAADALVRVADQLTRLERRIEKSGAQGGVGR